jgi:hypothetical protein
MDQLILEKDVKASPVEAASKQGVQIIRQTAAIGTPGEGDDLHPVTLLPKIPHQIAVINETSGDGVQAAINEQAHMH